jgi:hypothetical protein
MEPEVLFPKQNKGTHHPEVLFPKQNTIVLFWGEHFWFSRRIIPL